MITTRQALVSPSDADIVSQGMPSEEEMVSVSNSWRPYRSLGSWLMWRVPAPASPAKAKRKAKPKDANAAPDL